MFAQAARIRRIVTVSATPAIPAGSPRGPGLPSFDLLTPIAAAEILGVRVSRLMRWRGTGDGPRFVRLGHRTIRYRLADVEAFIATRICTSTAGA